ncbi:MAG: hypothetical protein ABIC82_04905 [bacterium]
MKDIKTERFTNKKPEEISFKGSPILDSPSKKEVRPNERTNENNQGVRTNERTFGRTPIKTKTQKSERTNVRTEKIKTTKASERTNERSDETLNTPKTTYTITMPDKRRKIRHSFDIFEDQKNTLEKLQLAIAEKNNNKKPSLGDLIQESIDLLTKQKIKELKNVEIIKQNSSERTNERSDGNI